MSFVGKKTSLQLNIESQLNVKTGLAINSTAIGFQGVWSATLPYAQPVGASYSQGSVTASNSLFLLTDALPRFYNNTPTVNDPTTINVLCVPVWRNLLKIGRPTDARNNNSRINCPALGNSRPDSFKTSYPGYGTFRDGWFVDQYYNRVPSSYGLVEDIYPPYKYPVDTQYSYISKNWGSGLIQGSGQGAPSNAAQTTFIAWDAEYQWRSDFAWITGWPGGYGWQNTSTSNPPQQRRDGIFDSYAAAYLPRPDLASVYPWRSRDLGKIEYDEYFRYGFIATVARQAYYEFWSDQNTRRSNQYIEFAKAWQQCYQFKTSQNKQISTFENSKNFIRGNFSNINDLTTNDISGVNLAFKAWGNDMIALGKSLDLSNIHRFGIPSVLLHTLQRHNALTDAVNAALLYSDIQSSELEAILLPSSEPTAEQEKKIYSSFELISGQDLQEICTIVNCATVGLSTLADLLNPQKMFPNSWPSLTIPNWSSDTLSSKIYDFIYIGNSVNPRIQNWGDYLDGILTPELALACGAFMMSMNQIRNIRQMDVEKLSQVIANLEVTNKDVPLVNSGDGVPGIVRLADQQLDKIALGSGNSGVHRFCDFYGAMSGIPYNDFYSPSQQLISQLITSNLTNVYRKLYQKSLFNNWALISRGKGWSDSWINTTGINEKYSYNLFTVDTIDKVYNPYYVFGDGSVTITINNASVPVNVNDIFDGPFTSARSTPGQNYNQSINRTTYSTGTLITFESSPGITPSSSIYVVNSSTANSVTFQSILNYNYYTRSQTGGSLVGNTVTYLNVESSVLSDVGVDWRLDRAYVTGKSWTPNPLPNPLNLGTLIISLNTGGYVPTQTTTYSSPYPYRGWPGLSRNINSDNDIYIIEWEYNGYPGNGILSGTVQDLIDAANVEILKIQRENKADVDKLNYYWSRIGDQLFKEQRSIPLAIPNNDGIYSGASQSDLDNFIRNIETYAQNTEYGDTAPILDAITDTTDAGGQSVIAAQREARNAQRLLNLGSDLNNDIDDNLLQNNASAKVVVQDGKIVDLIITNNGQGYTNGFGNGTNGFGNGTNGFGNGTLINESNTTMILIYPQGGVFGPGEGNNASIIPVIDETTKSIIGANIADQGSNYQDPVNVYVSPPPTTSRLGQAIEDGSFAGSPYSGDSQDPIPDNLLTDNDASYSVPQAIEQVTTCNCECWNE